MYLLNCVYKSSNESCNCGNISYLKLISINSCKPSTKLLLKLIMKIQKTKMSQKTKSPLPTGKGNKTSWCQMKNLLHQINRPPLPRRLKTFSSTWKKMFQWKIRCFLRCYAFLKLSWSHFMLNYTWEMFQWKVRCILLCYAFLKLS